MLTKTEIYLSNDIYSKLNVSSGSIFHGFLMEIITPEFAEEMHRNQLKPISQNLRFDRNESRWVWTINTLNQRASDEIEKALQGLLQVDLKHKNEIIKINKIIKYQGESYKTLTQKIYDQKPRNNISLDFYTPCSFKKSGNNVVLPDISMIYNNLFNKWDCFSNTVSINDKEALDFISDKTYAARYSIQTKNFHLESVLVRGFDGKITLKVNGADALVSLSNLIFEFSNYSGIGSRTTLGMGGVRVEFR